MLSAHAPLVRHPLAPWSGPAVSVAASCTLQAGGCGEFRYEVLGEVDRLLVPAAANGARVDGLWHHTCFELVVARAGEPGYVEFNFAPSGEWAAYAFEDYRRALTPPAAATPTIRTELGAGRLALTALVGPGAWPEPGRGGLEIGLTAVLESHDGALGYFALSHADARPEFHDRRGFALALGAQRAGS